MTSPTFSVVIPTFNRKSLLALALHSVLDQSFQDFEIVVVDNDSSDGTKEMINIMADPRIRFVEIQNRGVIGASRNAGIKASGGEFVAFLDDDDVWYSGKLEKCLEQMADSAISGVYHGMNLVVEGRMESFSPKSEFNYNQLLEKGNINIILSSVILRRKILEEVGLFDEEPNLVGAEDYELWLRIMGTGHILKPMSDVLGFYRYSSGFGGSQVERQVDAEMLAVRKEINRTHQYVNLRVRTAIAILYGSVYLFRSDKLRGARYFMKGLKVLLGGKYA